MNQFFTSGGQSFSIRWSFSISPSNEYSGLISFRMDGFDLLALQGTLKSLLQHHSSKASILQCSIFFMVQLSHPYMTTGKTIVLTSRTCVSKVMSLLFNMLFRFVTAFIVSEKRRLGINPFSITIKQTNYWSLRLHKQCHLCSQLSVRLKTKCNKRSSNE